MIIFFFINLVLSSFYLDNRTNPNSHSRVLQVASLSEDGSLNIDKRKDETLDKALVNDHYYPLQPPLPSFLVFPVFEVLKSMGICHDYDDDEGKSIFLLGSFLISSLPFVLLMMWLFIHLIKKGRSLFDSMLLSTLPLYASLFFIYTGVFYSHVLVGLCIAGSYFIIKKGEKLFLAGLLSGIAFFSEYLVAVIIAIWFMQLMLRKEFKQGILFGLGLLPFVFSFLAYNYYTTGNILLTVYSHNFVYEMTNIGFTYPKITALFQMLFSPWRGAFIFMPVLIASIFAIKWKWKGFKKFMTDPVLLPALILTFTLSAYSEWHGGWTFGPRYLMPAMILIYVGFADRIELKGSKKYFFWIPVLLGFVYVLLAKISVGFDIPSKFRYPFSEYILPRLLQGRFIETSVFGFSPVTSAMLFLALFSLLGIYLLTKYFKEKEHSK